jgi:hypothetical protein
LTKLIFHVILPEKGFGHQFPLLRLGGGRGVMKRMRGRFCDFGKPKLLPEIREKSGDSKCEAKLSSVGG